MEVEGGREGGREGGGKWNGGPGAASRGRVRPLLPYLEEKGREGIIWPKAQPSEVHIIFLDTRDLMVASKLRAVLTLVGG